MLFFSSQYLCGSNHQNYWYGPWYVCMGHDKLTQWVGNRKVTSNTLIHTIFSESLFHFLTETETETSALPGFKFSQFEDRLIIL